MADNVGYVVACINQASGRVEDTLPSQVLHFNVEDACFERDLHTAETEDAGRRDRFIACELVEVTGA